MMTMTVLERLKQRLPYGYVLAIIANMDEKVILEHEAEGSILDELETIFDWTNSNEGYQFWADVFDAIASGDALPKLPFRAIWKPNTYLCTVDESYIVNVQGGGRDVLLRIDFTEKPKSLGELYWRESHLAFCN